MTTPARVSTHVLGSDLRGRRPTVSHGSGVWMWDTDGKQYLDGCGGAFVVTLGHGLAGVADVLAEQTDRVAFAHRSQFTNEPLEQLAALVADLAPGDLNWFFPCSGGSEATESAIKLTAAYHRAHGHPTKTRVVARWRSYHGNTLGALSASGYLERRHGYESLLVNFPHVAPMDCYRCPFGLQPESCSLECADDLERVILAEGPDTIGAFIAEPVVAAAGGAPVAPPGYFTRIREICDQYGLLFIADEVVTGFGRTGRWFGIEHWDVQPDVMIVAKGIASGYAALGGVIVSDAVVEVLRERVGFFNHGHTYAGSPVASAVGLLVLQHLRDHDIVARAADTGELLLERARSLSDHPAVGDVRGLGMLVGIELVADRDTREPFPPQRRYAQTVVRIAHDMGLLVYPGSGNHDGISGDHVLLAPALNATRDEVTLMVDRLSEALTAVERLPDASVQ